MDTLQYTIHVKTVYDSLVKSDHMPIWCAIKCTKEKCTTITEDQKLLLTETKKAWVEWAGKVEERLENNECKIKEWWAGDI